MKFTILFELLSFQIREVSGRKFFLFQYGFTPLHLAAQSGHDSLVRMLLNQGVQVDATSTTMVSLFSPL